MARTKKPRDLKEMVDQLETQLNLLEEDATKAFDEGRKEYLPEVATKLRILVARFGSNKPLLFEVAKRFGIEQKVKLGGPPVPPRPGEAKAGDVISLDAFFDRRAFSWGTVNIGP